MGRREGGEAACRDREGPRGEELWDDVPRRGGQGGPQRQLQPLQGRLGHPGRRPRREGSCPSMAFSAGWVILPQSLRSMDVAISTACGFLDHIVVQTSVGAQRCISYLRKARPRPGQLHRARQDPRKARNGPCCGRPLRVSPRLFDLIQPRHPAVTPALYLGVGNTLVAPDLGHGFQVGL